MGGVPDSKYEPVNWLIDILVSTHCKGEIPRAYYKETHSGTATVVPGVTITRKDTLARELLWNSWTTGRCIPHK